MTRFIKDVLVMILQFLDERETRRIALDRDLRRLMLENERLRGGCKCRPQSSSCASRSP